MAFRIQIRRDDSAKWTINNPILLQGELGYETDTRYMKIGDGSTPWNLLSYWTGGLTGGGLIVKEDNVTVQNPTNVLNFSPEFDVLPGPSNTATVTLSSGGFPSNVNVFGDGIVGVTGATGLNFVGRSGAVTSNGKIANINIGGDTTPYFSVTATLSGGNFSSFSSSKGPDGQPLTGPNWNYVLSNTGNNITITHNLGTKPLSLATHGTDTTDVFVNYPFGISNSGFSLSYPTNMNSFTVYGVNSSNTGASLSGTVEVVWVFGATS